jgi:hypothetical protein
MGWFSRTDLLLQQILSLSLTFSSLSVTMLLAFLLCFIFLRALWVWEAYDSITLRGGIVQFIDNQILYVKISPRNYRIQRK